MPNLLQQSFNQDKKYLAETTLPIVTVTGAFREDLKRLHGLKNNNSTNDILFSRAHFSMPYGFIRNIWGSDKPEPKKAWLVDPTNYVDNSQWRKIIFTEKIGELIARKPWLKTIKDLIDKFGRNKLPILDSIEPPLSELFSQVDKPILSFHIAAGNILLEQGHTVIQVVTDPHVREDYLIHASNPKLTWCVFDKSTQQQLLAKTKQMKIKVEPNRVIVTGPPIDQRITQARNQKPIYTAAKRRPLRIVLTTGGLGTNKSEIKQIIEQILPILKEPNSPFQLMIYCGTEYDIFDMVKDQADEAGVRATIFNQQRDPSMSYNSEHRRTAQDDKSSTKAKTLTSNLCIVHHPQIYDANELLIEHAFPWGDLFITKPSGDMAYDAVASGAALFTLKPWGIWEEHIQAIFEKRNISQPAQVENIIPQLLAILKTGKSQTCWLEQAMKNATQIEPIFLKGNERIKSAASG